MTRIPFRLPNSDNFPRVPAGRRKARRRPHQAASAALLLAQNYAGVALPVTPLWPGSGCSLTPRGMDSATTDVAQIQQGRRRWPTVNHHRKRTEVGGHSSVARTGASVLVSGGAS